MPDSGFFMAVTYASLRCADGFTAVMLMGVVGLEY